MRAASFPANQLKGDLMSKLILRLFLTLFGVIAVVTGGTGTFVGMAGLSSFADVPFQLDLMSASGAFLENEMRFFAGAWMGIGFMLFYAALKWQESGVIIRLAGLAIFIGGIGRVMPLAVGGVVPDAMYPPIFLELIVFPLLVLWDYRLRAQD